MGMDHLSLMPPGFGPEHSRSGDAGSHGLASLRIPYGEVMRMENMVPANHSEYCIRQGSISQLENGNGRPGMMAVARVMGMPPPISSAPSEAWDIKSMAAHRHRALVAESSAQRIELETRMQTIPPQVCPPGFRPPSLHAEPGLSNACPPGFKPPPIYNEAMLPQSCPPGFKPPILFRENLAIMQPEMKFCNANPNTYRPEFHLDERPGDPIGRHDTMRGSSVYGATDRRGWYLNESSSGAGRVNENRFADPQIPKPYTSPSQPQSKHLPSHSHVVKLENENWRQETLPQRGRPLSPSVPVSNVSPPPALYPEAVWPRNMRANNLASTREVGKRRNYEDADNTSATPPFKRSRNGHAVDSSPWGRSRRDSEFERTRSDGLRMNGYNREGSYHSSLNTRKQMESRSMTELSDRTVEHWRDRQEWRTRRSPPHNLSHRRPLSPRDRNQAPISLEISWESELCTRPSSSRPISHRDRPSLTTLPRPDRSTGKEKQHRNDRYFDTRNRHVNHGVWSPRLSLRSRFRDECLNYDRRSLRAEERNFRKGSRSPRLLAGKRSSADETEDHASQWRAANMRGKIERKATQNGSLTTPHSSRAVGEFAKDERSRSGSQFPGFGVKQQLQQCDTKDNVVQKATNSLDCTAPALIDKIKMKRRLSSPLRTGTNPKILEMEMKTEHRENRGKKLPLQKVRLQVSDEKASSSSAKHVPQSLEVDWKIPPEKVTPRRRRIVGDLSLAKISGSDEGSPLPPKDGQENITEVLSPKLEQNRDEFHGGMLHRGKSSQLLLGSRSILDRRSIASERNEQALEARVIEGGLINPCVDLSRVSSEVTLHPPSVGHGTDIQLTTVNEIGTGVSESTGQKVIFTGHRSEHIPSVKLQKTASGCDLESGTSDAGLLQEDVAGHSCSERTKEVLPSLTVKKEDMRVNPSVRESASFLGKFVEREVLLFGTNLNASIPLAIETNKGFQQPNCSTAEGLHVFVPFELHDLSTFRDDRHAKLPGGSVLEKIELAKITTDNGEVDLVQGEHDVKVSPHPSDLIDASAIGDTLVMQLDRADKEQTHMVTKLASVLTDSRPVGVSEETEVMSIVPQLSDLQDSNAKENHQAEKLGRFTQGSIESGTKLVRVSMVEGEVVPTEGKENLEVTKHPSGEAVKRIMHFDQEYGKKQKLMHTDRGGNVKQVLNAEDAIANNKKTNVLESSSGTERTNPDSSLVANEMLSFKGGIQHTTSSTKTVDTFPLSSHLSGPPTATPQLGAAARLQKSNKTWIREVKAVSAPRVSNTLQQRPMVVAQPSTYIRKKFSIIRFPAPQVSAQSNPLTKLPQEVASKSGNMNSSLSTSKLLRRHEVNTMSTSNASATSSMKTANTDMSDLGAIPYENSRSSTVRRLNPVEDETLVSKPEFIVSDMPATSKLSASKPSHFGTSSGLTTLACSPASKSPDRGTDEAVGGVVSGPRLYAKRESNPILIGPTPLCAPPILRPSLENCDVPLGYIKRKTNQLVRCNHHREVSSNSAPQNVLAEVGHQVKFLNKQRRWSAQLQTKTKLGRVLSQKKGKTLGLARVWTLSNEGKRTTTALGVSREWRYPLFPWKRVDMVAPRSRRGRPLHEGKMGALFFHISNQLQRYRSGHPLYTRSADGFSLHRSGVMSRSGANLKWTKSLMKQSILASEAATKVVAEAEKKKRDKKEAVVMAVAKSRDNRRAVQESCKQAKLRSGTGDPSLVSSLEPLGIGGAVYVRKGFGNQLVRDSRTIARAFASEKVRWSLHNARLRRAKKQAFCVYYTRFGVCKRGDGKCLYIHDPEKIAVCTKFLRGSCSDPGCRLTHKVIPERMSDCSYFLEGMCTNESCPYRHVNVNPKAPICEGFLQGYCAEGDMCNKKHTYVCPEYTSTGKCSSSTCKLRHLKKTKQPTSTSVDNVGSKREGRYFAPPATADGEYQGQSVSTTTVGGDKIAESGDDRADFISVDEIDLDSSKENQDVDKFLDHRGVVLLSKLPKGGPSNVLESLLKPRFLLKRDVIS